MVDTKRIRRILMSEVDKYVISVQSLNDPYDDTLNHEEVVKNFFRYVAAWEEWTGYMNIELSNLI